MFVIFDPDFSKKAGVNVFSQLALNDGKWKMLFPYPFVPLPLCLLKPASHHRAIRANTPQPRYSRV